MEGSSALNTGVKCYLFQSDKNLSDDAEGLKIFDKWEQIEWA